MTEARRLLITGGAGRMATLLRPRLRRPGRHLHLLDVRPIDHPEPGETPWQGSLADPDLLLAACRESDAVLHLGGQPTETAWSSIVADNIDGTQALLEAVVQAGVRRVMLASSNHAVGLRSREESPLAADSAPRPDSYYGLSKAVVEMLGLLYHQRHGLDVSCLRIGRCVAEPTDARALVNWLSPDDAARLVEACLSVSGPAHRTLWGVSANTRGWFDLEAGHRIGYWPQDDSEVFASSVPDSDDPAEPLVGGPFSRRALGSRRPTRASVPLTAVPEASGDHDPASPPGGLSR